MITLPALKVREVFLIGISAYTHLAPKLITHLYHNVRTGWQRKSLWLPLYHLHHRDSQREVITFYYLFHKLIILFLYTILLF
jgi:hypothetical protein